MSKTGAVLEPGKKLSFEDFKQTVIADYRLAMESREASLMGRKEVLTGKAKFGIFGDGKEVPQIAMAKAFKNGDFRSGYYRDQTFMFATKNLNLKEWFAGLYANTDQKAEPMSAGRQMGGHFATWSVDENGEWVDLTAQKNSSSDISPTGSQMPRLLGLAFASHFYRINKDLKNPAFEKFSANGNEVAFGTIGDASTSEGLFWETMNAAGVLQVPMLVSVWDDGHGISVPKKYQTTKESISEIMKGFQRDDQGNGFEIFKVKGWDYVALCETYEKAAAICREKHIPVLVHVEELTQPQGHSTSGSHERYKTKERLEWELQYDCVRKMRDWMIESAIATEAELNTIDEESKESVRFAKSEAWKEFNAPIKDELKVILSLLDKVSDNTSNEEVKKLKSEITSAIEPTRREITSVARKVLRALRAEDFAAKKELKQWIQDSARENEERYSSHLHSQSKNNALNIQPLAPQFSDEKLVDGREVLRENFDIILKTHPEVLIFGEDSGKIGGVNQGLEGLQKKYGEHRVFDTGIREATIMGQAIGLALRGLRPIAEIQYLDYLLYALQIMSDDLATLQYRTKGKQKAPVIIRTRGHRLEGIWHSGSPMGMIVHSLRGIHVCVPRNMVQAAGFYNTLLQSDEPAIIIEPLNGYRLKEKLPSNLGEFRTPLGIPEIVNIGSDITLVSYGSTLRLVQEAAKQLEKEGISAEVIDVQTLLPFDINHNIAESVKKTNKVIFIDEDVPGGATSYMMQQVIERQGAFKYLDAEPRTLSAKSHRPPYGSDGDYFTKPSVEDIFEAVYDMMHTYDPSQYPSIY